MLLKAKWAFVGVKMDNKEIWLYWIASFISMQIDLCLELLVNSQLLI